MDAWTVDVRVWRYDVYAGSVVMMPLADVADMLYGAGLIGPAEWIRLTKGADRDHRYLLPRS